MENLKYYKTVLFLSAKTGLSDFVGSSPAVIEFARFTSLNLKD